MASFCRPEACGVTPSATLATSQWWLLCPAGHTHCLALSSYTTAKQTADHPQRFKKKRRKLSKDRHWSHFLILVTSSVSRGPSFPSLCIYLPNQPQVGVFALSLHCISQRLDTLVALFGHLFGPCQPTARLHLQPTLTEQTDKRLPKCFGSTSLTCSGF